jgi:hypothetical protein
VKAENTRTAKERIALMADFVAQAHHEIVAGGE